MATEHSDHATTDHIAAHAHDAIDTIASSAGKGEERIRDTGQQVQDRSEALVSAVHEFVRDNPIAAIGLAFAAGTLVSRLTRRH